MDTPSSGPERLRRPIQFTPGVGPRRSAVLARLGIKTVSDCLFHFPRDYRDMSDLRAIEDLQDGESVSVCGVVAEADLREFGPSKSVMGVLIRQNQTYLRAVWFNQPFMRHRVAVGRRVLLSGKVKRQLMSWEMVHPRLELLGDDEEPTQGRVEPIYPLTEGITQWQMRRIVQGVVTEHADDLEEVFPERLLQQFQLLPIREAVREVHAPTSPEQLQRARRRLIYQELLVLQLAIALRQWKLRQQRTAPQLAASAKIDARIRRLFPFELTDDQHQAIREIAEDMGRDYPMNRLLQGEVGSGKTVVAQYAMLLAVAHGYQATVMVPTEILALQHMRTLFSNLKESRVRMVLLTGSLTAAERRKTLEQIAAGEVDIVVGTHAVLQQDVRFARLGLVVIDEQHKFGVQQRASLRQAGVDPHYLVMTATPIPRTVAVTLYGDQEVSTIRQVPPGRQTVNCYLGDPAQRDSWWQFFARKLQEGRQGYVIAPLVDEDDAGQLASVEQLYESLANGALEAFRINLVHGRLPAAEKQAAMDSFQSGETQVLVATSVVEVGVDVPNATLMTIENGERFGLAQLHQLRGRVSRGKHPGFVCVFADTDNDEARQRLQAFVDTRDGFELSELDFQLRGPGDPLGTKQHGLPPLRIADLRRDSEILLEARRDAAAMLISDPGLQSEDVAAVRRMVLRRYGRVLDLVGV